MRTGKAKGGRAGNWLVPLGLGLVVLGATVLVGPRLVDTRPAAASPWRLAAAQGYVWPFDPTQGPGTFLLVAPAGRAAATQGLLADGGPSSLSWWTPNLAVLQNATLNSTVDRCPCVQGGVDTLLRVTAYVFLADGSLLASNDSPERAARFRPSGDYVALPNGTWHLGPGPVPAGAQGLPDEWKPVLDAVQGRLAGLGAGGVATVALMHHPHDDVVGPLYVTLRIDGLDAAGPA